MADKARSDHPGVQEQLDRLARLSPGGDRLGLERITALLERLGRPQDRLPPGCHVAGTNGKGSTCAFLRAALVAAGHRVHVFTSPHLVRFNERVRLAGRLIEDEALALLLREVLDAGAELEPSFFEVTAAAAMLAFARTPAEALVLEVGMGGRLDATNVVKRPLVTGIAALGLDHQQWLGNTLAEIAGEKAGIARAGVPLVTLRYGVEAAERVGKIAAACGAQWLPQGSAWDVSLEAGGLIYTDDRGELRLPLPALAGPHQALNAGLAVAMLRHQTRLEIGAEALSAAMTSVKWPARLQCLSAGPLVGAREAWLDGGHNAAAAIALAEAMRSRAPFTLVAGCLRTKDARGLLMPFRGLAAEVLTVPVSGQECFTPRELAVVAEELGLSARRFADVGAALADAPADPPLLIAGSLYLAGEVLRLNGEVLD
jgi:dihydrofolate synthase/folylpolyglutamate synthase